MGTGLDFLEGQGWKRGYGDSWRWERDKILVAYI